MEPRYDKQIEFKQWTVNSQQPVPGEREKLKSKQRFAKLLQNLRGPEAVLLVEHFKAL